MIARTALVLFLIAGHGAASRADLAETIAAIKPAIVRIGTYEVTRRPPAALMGTGFGVGDGRHVVTSLHVVNHVSDEAGSERIVVFVGVGSESEMRDATVIAADLVHDAALLRIDGPALPVLRLASESDGREGDDIAFTGFPIGAALGLHPATHRGIIAAWTPFVMPVVDPGQLSTAMIKQLKEGPFYIYQLDATAYPGNSGSPLYRPTDGVVLGILSSVYVKDSKETAISDPSGISYAIPIRYARALLIDLGLVP
ncbi:MAG: serine protease [Alphaproteobacteria bacterium]|nr:serine protease [Alphaproteobacteria bacterium]